MAKLWARPVGGRVLVPLKFVRGASNSPRSPTIQIFFHCRLQNEFILRFPCCVDVCSQRNRIILVTKITGIKNAVGKSFLRLEFCASEEYPPPSPRRYTDSNVVECDRTQTKKYIYTPSTLGFFYKDTPLDIAYLL